MAPERSTKAEADYLVGAPKFIRAIPQIKPLGHGSAISRGWQIQVTDVFRKSEPHKAIKCLVVMAKARRAPPPLPHPTPSSALEWYGKRIRGLNYELWHDNPDGTTVRGWHEHVWSPREQDAHVVPTRPEPTRKQLLDILKWGLRKWNIDILEEQVSMNADDD